MFKNDYFEVDLVHFIVLLKEINITIEMRGNPN